MQVILSYFTIVTDWGFSWSGVRKISSLRGDIAAMSECFLASWAVQWILCAGALAALCLMSFCMPLFASFRAYAFYGTGTILASVLFPLWLLTGLERIRELAVTQLVIRASAVPLVFLFVQKPGDGALVLAASAMTALIGGILAIVWITRFIPIDWHWPKSRSIRSEFVEGGAIFLSRIWIVAYSSLIPTILGALIGVIAVGNYVLADKICSGVRSLLAPLSQALFPRMSYLFAHDRKKAIHLLWRSGTLMVALSATSSLVLFLSARWLVFLFAGGKFLGAATLLRWMSPLPLVIVLSNIFGLQIMLPNRMTRAFNSILFGAGAFSLSAIGFLVSWKGAEGAAMNTLFAECFVTGSMALYLAYVGRRSLKSYEYENGDELR